METDSNHLETKLQSLTQWTGGDRNLWSAALAIDDMTPRVKTPLLHRLLLQPMPQLIAAAAIIIVAISVVMTVMTSMTRSGRDISRFQMSAPDESRAIETPSALKSTAPAGGFGGGASDPPYSAMQTSDVPTADTLNRQVVQKATIDIITDDVRATFLKASLLISEAHGEFVQESSLTGAEVSASATLVLRVRASRLNDALNALRKLGEVASESLHGDDVTSQMIDLDARLRNEEHIEQELLELLDTRTDAPLADVLSVRQELYNVRLRIEQYQAQREQLSRLVSLATILVLIHPRDDDAKKPEAEATTIGEYFDESVSRSWERGLHTLVDTAGFLIRVLVGGLFWWVLAVAALVAARALVKRSATVREREPAG